MVIANPPLAEPVIDPGGVTIKPPFEMGVANLECLMRFILTVKRICGENLKRINMKRYYRNCCLARAMSRESLSAIN